jgi:6-pyruvoyltetrahydropterin/6-carboxytetrahydropterin synthase
MKLAKEFRWEMGHRLPEHAGSCRNVHGHSYKLVVEVEGGVREDGMIIDLQDIARAVKPLLEKLDHAFLCEEADVEMLAFLQQHSMKVYIIPYPSTVENICRLIANELEPFMFGYENVDQFSVRVYETPNSMAELCRTPSGKE